MWIVQFYCGSSIVSVHSKHLLFSYHIKWDTIQTLAWSLPCLFNLISRDISGSMVCSQDLCEWPKQGDCSKNKAREGVQGFLVLGKCFSFHISWKKCSLNWYWSWKCGALAKRNARMWSEYRHHSVWVMNFQCLLINSTSKLTDYS